MVSSAHVLTPNYNVQFILFVLRNTEQKPLRHFQKLSPQTTLHGTSPRDKLAECMEVKAMLAVVQSFEQLPLEKSSASYMSCEL